MRRVLASVLGAVVLLTAAMAPADTRLLDFDDLLDWRDDDHEAALEAFLTTCGDLEGADWVSVCHLGTQQRGNARQFFEMFFRPVLVGQQPALFTGYYEPEIDGALSPGGPFRHPIYSVPSGLTQPWHTRREIEEFGLLAGRGLEIAWLDDAVEVYFLQVQGSGRIRLRDGSVVRVGYGARNGQPYRSIGQELTRRGTFAPHQVSADVIGNWVRRNPVAGRELLWHNPSYIFFRQLDNVDPTLGPLGAMNRPITAMRSVAVDPDHTPLGAPVWIEKGGATPMRRLMVAQDTGGAIQGPQRADIFYGTGEAAGRAAGRVRDPGRMIVLLPIEMALQVTAGV